MNYLETLLNPTTQLSWKKSEGQPCYHAFKGEIFYNLCKYIDPTTNRTIFSLNIDDLKKYIKNVEDLTINDSHEYYDSIREIYDYAQSNFSTIAA